MELEFDEAAHLIKALGIPSRPGVVAELMREIACEKPDLRYIAELIGRDAGLASTLVKLANSRLVGSQARVHDVSAALAAVDLQSCVGVVAERMLRGIFDSFGESSMTAFWNTASTLSAMIAHLARECGVCSQHHAQLFGLFRDCGVPLLMARYFSYRKLYRDAMANGGARLISVERCRFGIDHALVGACLARSWGLPQTIVEAIRLHHVRDAAAAQAEPGYERHAKLIAVGVLADVMLRSEDMRSVEPRWMGELEFACHVLGLTSERVLLLHYELSNLLQGI